MSPRDIPAEAPPPGLADPAPRARPPIWLLVAMIGLGPFAMQILVPALPALSAALGAQPAEVQLTVTLYLIAVGAGQLVYGPLSDRFGRRPLLLGGLSVFVLASLAAAMAETIGGLVAARVAQAIGSCAGVVLARAVIRDVWPRDRAASVLGYVTMGMTVAPMIAPVLGSILLEHVGWRGAMLACVAFGLPLAVAAWLRLPETLPAPQPMPGPAAILDAYRTLWRIPSYRCFAALTACSTGAFFAFLGGAPYVVVQGMGHSPVVFALAFSTLSITFAAGSWAAGRYSARVGLLRMLAIGNWITVGGALSAVLVVVLLPPDIVLFFVPMAVVAMGNGMTQPNSIAGALSARPQLAGTASALVGAMQMGGGAAMSTLVSLVEFGAGIGTALAMAGAGIGTALALRGARRAMGG